MFPAVVCKRTCVVVGEVVGDGEVDGDGEVVGAGVGVGVGFVVWLPCPSIAYAAMPTMIIAIIAITRNSVLLDFFFELLGDIFEYSTAIHIRFFPDSKFSGFYRLKQFKGKPKCSQSGLLSFIWRKK
jgi:hypothetical protein